jgi:hypothetical protein
MKPRLFGFEMHSSVLVDVPVQRAWDVVAEAGRWADWATVCTAVWDAPGRADEWEIGHQFGFRLKMGTRTVPFHVTVTRFQSDHSSERLIEWTSTKFTIIAARTNSVVGDPDPESGACRVTDRKLFSSPVLPIGLAYPRWLIRRMTESWLNDLKQEAESG